MTEMLNEEEPNEEFLNTFDLGIVLPEVKEGLRSNLGSMAGFRADFRLLYPCINQGYLFCSIVNNTKNLNFLQNHKNDRFSDFV